MVLVTPAANGGDITPEGTKKTKLTPIDPKGDNAGQRLVEYFVVVSSVPRRMPDNNNRNDQEEDAPKDHINTTNASLADWRVDLSFEIDEEEFSGTYDFAPVISGRYPVMDHRDNPLHENVTFFCHPSGGIRLRTEAHMPKVHYFVATGGHGKQMYGTCLTLWEPVFLALRKKDSVGAGGRNNQEEEKDKEVFLPKCLVLLSTYPYLMAFREYLTQLNRLSKMGEMTLPIERYIANFCSELPAPPPGSFEVQTTVLDSVIKIWSPPHNQPIPWVSLPFSTLFECLDTDNIILVWHCLVLERQVLLTSTQLSILTLTAEIFLSLLFPMRWSHAYIPVLPHFLIPILSAPMPFLCGINKANLADALYDLSSECVLVDLDKNLVTLGPDTQALPPIPPAQLAALREQLEENVGMVFREARCLTKNDDYSDSGAHLPNHIKLMAEGMWESKLCLFDEAFHLMFTPEESRKNLLNGNDTSGMDWSDRELDPMRLLSPAEKQTLRKQSTWDAVQEAFLDTFVYLLRNFRKFLVFPSKHNEGSYGGAGFRSKEFIETQRFDMREFLEQFIGTQMFDNFITKRLYGSGEADVAFFDQAVDRFLKHAGYFSDVDLSGRIMHAAGAATAATTGVGVGVGVVVGVSGKESSNTPNKSGGGGGTAAGSKSNRPKRSAVASYKKDTEPLLQSARVHRKLKTIVPPEPSGEGLPPHPIAGSSSNYFTADGGVVVTNNTTGATSFTGDEGTNYITDDNASIGTASTTSAAAATNSTTNNNAYRSVQDKAADILQKNKLRYVYPAFPNEFNCDLFGVPRPLPSAVIAEFDRQRKDAAQFRRKKSLKRVQVNKNQHLHLAHKHNLSTSGNIDGPEPPPSPEVATFTVFFMAFTAMVGKELMELSSSVDPYTSERTILSTYVPTTEVPVEGSSVMGDESNRTEMSENNNANNNNIIVVDEEEKEGVAEMKTTRPDMNGMFNDDDEEEVPMTTKAAATTATTTDRNSNVNQDVFNNNDGNKKRNDTTSAIEKTNSKDSECSKASQPRKRFADSLSALQIEEAKATGRAQLGLAFEMLTMMKKRALKADPEAYQCLIDACGRVGDTKRATELLAKMHEDGIVADGTVYACLVSAFSAESAWKTQGGSSKEKEELPAWANSTSIEMDWNKLQKRSLLDRLRGKVDTGEEDEDEEEEVTGGTIYRIRSLIARRKQKDSSKKASSSSGGGGVAGGGSVDDMVNGTNNAANGNNNRMEFFVTETVERQIALGENLLEIVFPDISVDTENETCPRCNFLLSDDDVVIGWTPGDNNDYTTSCPNCTQRFVPHFCVQSTSPSFMGSRGPASPLMCERLSPWVLQKEIRSVMSDREGIENLLSPEWREHEYKNAVLWWNLVLSCMRYRFPFSFLLQGSFEQNLIAPMPEDDS